MRAILEERNRDLLTSSRRLVHLLGSADIAPVLEEYRARMLDLCRAAGHSAEQNLTHLALGEDAIIPEVLSNTRIVDRLLRLMSVRMATPVLRASASDYPVVVTIGWLHSTHGRTAAFPPAFADGGVASWPLLVWHAPLYFFPCLEQRGLLYIPLLFHEFGHILYALYKSELDDLVGELQSAVAASLLPASRRNDRHALHQAAERQSIVNTWYSWTQELFCDAIGLAVGGPAFLHAFASHLSRLESADYYQSPEELGVSEHPVTILRIRFLLRRARGSGFQDATDRVSSRWHAIGEGLRVTEDYHGFYVSSLDKVIETTIDDMLTVVSVRAATGRDVDGGEWDPSMYTPVQLFNRAWSKKLTQPESYELWEQNQLARWADAANVEAISTLE